MKKWCNSKPSFVGTLFNGETYTQTGGLCSGRSNPLLTVSIILLPPTEQNNDPLGKEPSTTQSAVWMSQLLLNN